MSTYKAPIIEYNDSDPAQMLISYATEQNNALTKYFSENPSGGSSVRSLTHAQLLAEITAGMLNAGESILITDYATKHNIQDGSNYLEELHTETVEPLLVYATSSDTLDIRAKSVLFPKDIIHYDVADVVCEDKSTQRTGKITFRKDHLGNETHYDFRGVIFRRWKLDLSLYTPWVSAGTFAKGDKITYNNTLFYCIQAIAGSTSNPEILTENFNYVIDNQRYLAWQSTTIELGGDPISGSALQIPVSVSYFDFYTFSNSLGEQKSEWFTNVKIGIFFYGYYNSIVFIETDTDQTFGMTFDSLCYFMTFGSNNYSCTFGNDNYATVFDSSNTYMTFGNNNANIIVGYKNNSIKLGDSNYAITFGGDNSGITFGTDNSADTFGNHNNYLTFGNNNVSNAFGDGNAVNTLGNGNANNTFGNGNVYNTFGSGNANHTFNIVISKNTFKNTIDGISIDYSGATHLVGDYDCEISRRADGTAKLTYINNSDVLTVVAVNA